MKLRSLHLRDYRSFVDTHIPFEEDVTVLVGINGAGKTAILDAIACALGQIVAKIPGVPAEDRPSWHDLVHEDIRVLKKDQSAAGVRVAAEFEDHVHFARVLRAPLRMVVNKALPDGTIVELSLNQLSDGYRSMLAMVMDFSRRLVQANPDLENPLEAEAILLIDEVELHLHPEWQQEVIPALRRAFPNTQLILTTHSPQVLTTIDSRCIRILREDHVESAPPGTSGAESKRMLETVLGTESRPPGNPAVAALARLFQCIREDNLEEAKRLADELDGSFGGNDPSIDEARLKTT
jgi:predicted ATP-binding protein involved in virulence